MLENESKKQEKSPEVVAKPTRRQHSAEYKESILQAVDRMTGRGEIGALLRREGLYWSNLQKWRQQRADGILGGGRRGRPVQAKKDARDLELEALQRANDALNEKLRQAELIIDVQKKISELLSLNRTERNDSTQPNR